MPVSPSPPHRLRPARVADVVLRDDFWAPRQHTLQTRTLPSQYQQLEEAGVFAQLDVGRPPGPLRIPPDPVHGVTMQMFWDSDVGKWIEAVAYTVAHARDARLEARVDDLASQLQRAQSPDGYLNTYFLQRCPDQRWTNLRDTHELYCAGHLLEGAVAYFEATGKRTLLDVMCRYVDHIAAVFGDEPGQKRGYCGHPEIELALVRLHAVTRNQAHLDLARFFIDARGTQPHYFDLEAVERGSDPAIYPMRTYEYSQSHIPVRAQRKVVGHAVRAMYLYCAMADLSGALDDVELRRACEFLWHDLVTRRLYVTGGMGPSATNEGFTVDYDLPNETAYAETCAAVGLVLWAHRMLHLVGDGVYADAMELALYNGALSGIALDGEHYFYDNKLESRGDHHRWRWHRCPCCPTNIARLLGSVGRYAYSTALDQVAIHLYAESQATFDLPPGTVQIIQATRYPWDGDVCVTVAQTPGSPWTLALRIPAWCRTALLQINDEEVDIEPLISRGYARVSRAWRAGDQVKISLPMPVERVRAHPEIRADAGRVALKRGPVVYCLEASDGVVPPHLIVLPDSTTFEPYFDGGLLGGVYVIRCKATYSAPQQWGDTLYRSDPPPSQEQLITMIPYCLWDHRTAGEMRVWLRTS